MPSAGGRSRIARALGANARQLGAFAWSEASFVTVGGLLLGGLIAGGLSIVLVKVLTGVFDPPPDALAIPGLYLGTVTLVALLAVTVATVGKLCAACASRGSRRCAICSGPLAE